MKKRIRFTFLAFFAWTLVGYAQAVRHYPVTGLILKIDQPHRTFVASCSAIPGYMEAMVMPYKVRDEKILDGLKPSMLVEFSLVVERDDSYVDHIQIHDYQNVEQEPLRARRLQLLENLENSNKTDPAANGLALGQKAADFTLTDQTGARVTLSQFAGKLVGISFLYTSCPLPNYCFRLSNNFGILQKRFADRMPSDLVLLSITFDPAHDDVNVLAKYAGIWKADPHSWHFLTGSLSDIKAVCRMFGLNFWPEEGAFTHSLHTVVIDRQGRLAANFEGNEFTAEQLGDFVETLLTQEH